MGREFEGLQHRRFYLFELVNSFADALKIGILYYLIETELQLLASHFYYKSS